jgi:predicted phage terminase large subunit-like protein
MGSMTRSVTPSTTPSDGSWSAVPTATLLKLPWDLLSRPEQRPPSGDWLTWLILAGRGWGKTRTGAEWVHANVGRYGRWILGGRTSGDLRDIMVEGETGLLRTAPRHARPQYEPSKRRIVWPNGAVAALRSADEPEGFRGLQAEAVWADELAAWENPDAWDQLQLGLRLGPRPRQVVTTTPKPSALIKALLRDEGTVVTRGSTYDNRANLAPAFFRQIVTRYEGTRLGRQELHAEVLEDVEGALWTLAMIDATRRPPPLIHIRGEDVRDLNRIVVAIDPAVSAGEDSDETGIIVAGLGHDGRGYVLADRSTRAHPSDWARRAIAAFDEFGADRIVAEVNNGGELVETVIRTIRSTVPYRAVHASRGKRTRAEPIAALYEQGRVSHVEPLAALEDQMTSYTPESGNSPDRLDALVWALTDLMLGSTTEGDFSLVA